MDNPKANTGNLIKKGHYCSNLRLAVIKLILIFMLALLWLPAAWSQTADQKAESNGGVYELPEVVVTAEKMEQNIQNVPISIANFSAEQIEDAAITSIAGVSDEVPNLHIVDWGSRRDAYVYIRGIGSSRQQDSAVGLYIDDVPLINVGTFLTELAEIERIEVLRGPQGTLYGRNTLAGVINIVTKKLTNERKCSATVAFGDYGLQDYRIAHRGPIIRDKLFVGLSLVKSTRDGYSEDDLLGIDTDGRDSSSGRFNLHWTPDDRLDALFSIDAEMDRDGAIPLTDLTQVRQNPHHVSHNREGFQDRDLYGPSIRLKYNTTHASLTSITAWRKWNQESGMDQDFSPADVLISDWAEDQTQLTQEIRLTSPDSSALRWLLGAFYFSDNFDDDVVIEYGANAAELLGSPIPGGYQNHKYSAYKNKGYALFGSMTYTIKDRLDLTAGLRQDHEAKELDYEEYDFLGMVTPGSEKNFGHEEDFNELIPRVAVGYHMSSDLMSYVSATKGYKSGGFNSVSNSTDAVYSPEHSWNYEFGAKSSWLRRTLNLRLATFYIKWDNQQIVQFLPPNQTIIRNAGKSHSAGAELEASFYPLRELQLTSGFGYVDAVFDEYADPVLGINHDDNKIPVAPKYNMNLAAQYRREIHRKINLFTRIELQGVGDFYWDPANTLEEKAYQLVNIRLGVEGKHWGVNLWARNVLNEEYAAIALQTQGFPAWGQAGDPRTFGARISARF